MFLKVIKKVQHIIKILQINSRIRYLNRIEEPPLGSADWLAWCELQMGGIQKNVSRRKVSNLDPRTKKNIQTGGMTGGDRMIHHNYANVYAKYLKKFISYEKLNILECGILKGTGLGVFSKLFPQAMLIGLDIDLSHTKSNLIFLKEKGAFKLRDPLLFVFDQFQPNTDEIKLILNKKLNIIIDDGFHSDEAILNTFKALKPFLSNDFVYFIEDNYTVSSLIKENYKEYHVEPFGELTVVTPREIAS